MSKRYWKKKDCEKIYVSKSAYKDFEYAIEQFFELKGTREYDSQDIMKR